jgi:hypothetical protein
MLSSIITPTDFGSILSTLTPPARPHPLSSNAIASPRSEVAPSLERWYVLIVMCLVYAIKMAARYIVTTVF